MGVALKHPVVIISVTFCKASIFSQDFLLFHILISCILFLVIFSIIKCY